MSCPAGYTCDTSPRVAALAAASETFETGQRIKHWGRDIIWSENHLPASRLESLRSVGDPLADDALAALDVKPGDDTLDALLTYTSQPSHEQKSPAPQQLLTQVMTVPDWVDWDRLQRGQQVYWRYCLFMDNAFFHFLLPIMFAAPRITKTLSSTGYLVGMKTEQRIFETAQFVDNVVHSLDYLRPVSGTAWKSILRVRFLHSGARVRLLKFGRAYPKYYNLKDYGVPINQEDLLSVLFTCSNTMWQVMERRMNVRMDTQEREDYMHVWRYVGYMIGIDDVLGATQTPERADACQESIMLHLADPDSESGRLCSTMLQNLASHPTLFFKFTKHIALLDQYKLHMALTEHLVGSEVWKEYGLPLASRRYRVYREVIVRLMSFDLWLVTTSPRWLRIRSSLFRKIQSAMIARKLGDKRSQYELKELPEKREEPVVIQMADDIIGGRL